MAKERDLLNRAKAMRLDPTEWEKRLWRHLSNSQLGHKFRRQAVIAPCICDFLCPSKALIIEIDGDTHDPTADARRDHRLAEQGYRTIRFTNADVRDNIEGVLTQVSNILSILPDRWPRSPTPTPPLKGRGLKNDTSKSPSPSGEGLGWGEPGNPSKGNSPC